jgi:hypothetical protein
MPSCQYKSYVSFLLPACVSSVPTNSHAWQHLRLPTFPTICCCTTLTEMPLSQICLVWALSQSHDLSFYITAVFSRLSLSHCFLPMRSLSLLRLIMTPITSHDYPKVKPH